MTAQPEIIEDASPSTKSDAEKTLDANKVYYWNGEALFPFTVDRQILYTRLRQQAGRASHVQEFIAEATFLLYACSVAFNDVPELLLDPKRAMSEALQWGTKNIGRGKQEEAIELCLTIYNDAHDYEVGVKSPSTNTPPDTKPGKS